MHLKNGVSETAVNIFCDHFIMMTIRNLIKLESKFEIVIKSYHIYHFDNVNYQDNISMMMMTIM